MFTQPSNYEIDIICGIASYLVETTNASCSHLIHILSDDLLFVVLSSPLIVCNEGASGCDDDAVRFYTAASTVITVTFNNSISKNKKQKK